MKRQLQKFLKLTSFLLILTLLLVLGGNVFFTHTIPPVVVFSKDYKDTSQPYSLVSTTIVMPWAPMTFSPGTIVLAKEGATLFSLAPLNIKGTKEQPVEFKTENKKVFWGGISVRNAPLVLSYAVIRNAGIGIRIRSNESVVEHLLLDHVINGVYVRESSVRLSYLDIYSVKYAPNENLNVLKFSNCDVVLENSIIRTPMTALKIDALDMGYCSNSKIINNTFYGSPQEDTDAIDIGDNSKNIEIRGNRIYDFADKGISMGEHSQATATNNLIVNTGIGMSAKDGATLQGSRNTFIKTATALSSSIEKEKVLGGSIHMTQSVFYQCPAILYKSEESVLTINNSMSNTAIIPGEKNLIKQPVFVNASIGDYMLQNNDYYGWKRDNFSNSLGHK